MARDAINVAIPTQDASQSVESVKITKQAVTQANGIKINDAFKNKNNSLQITIENTYTSADSTLTVKAGDNYPNKVLGDLSVPLTKATAGTSGSPNVPTLTVVLIEDISRFENRDGSVCLDFSTSFTGNIWAVAKRAGLKPVA